MRLKTEVSIAAGAAALAVLLGGVAAWRVSRALRYATDEVHAEQNEQFVMRSLPASGEEEFEGISAPSVFSQAAAFHDHLYIAGPAGLLEYDARGSLLKQYAVGRELPASALVAMARGLLNDSRKQELIIATEKDGLVAFDGHAFRQIFPQDADARGITSILPLASGHLLFGTKKRGVLLYDGKQIT